MCAAARFAEPQGLCLLPEDVAARLGELVASMDGDGDGSGSVVVAEALRRRRTRERARWEAFQRRKRESASGANEHGEAPRAWWAPRRAAAVTREDGGVADAAAPRGDDAPDTHALDPELSAERERAEKEQAEYERRKVMHAKAERGEERRAKHNKRRERLRGTFLFLSHATPKQ